MSTVHIILLYCYVAVIMFLALLEQWQWEDALLSTVLALAWPITMPAAILRRVIWKG